MEKFGLLGEHLGHSFSETIHDLFFKKTGIKGEYELYERKTEDIKELLNEVRAGKIKGLNVTIPYKVEVMKYLDTLSEEASAIGAVNTIAYKDGKLGGYNTDYYGFLETLKVNNLKVEDKRILILGTGGAAKAIYGTLTALNVDTVYLATIEKDDRFKIRNKDSIINYVDIKNLKNIEGIINCTPVGMYPQVDNIPLPADGFIPVKYLIDVIYNPEETALMEKYASMGVKTINGLMMLVVQAVRSEEIWNGTEADDKIIKEIYEDVRKILYKLRGRQ